MGLRHSSAYKSNANLIFSVNFNISLGHSSLINLHVGCEKSQVHSNLCIENSSWKEKKNVTVCREIMFVISSRLG